MLLLLIAIVLLLWIMETSGLVQGEKAFVVASSSFWLKLSPTPKPLYSESIQVLQSSVNTALQVQIATTDQSTLSTRIDPLTSQVRMDLYEIQNIDTIFQAVIFGNVTEAYTCIALFALASVRTNQSEGAAEYPVDSIRSQIDTDLVELLDSSAFLGQILSNTKWSANNISNDVILQLYHIESVSIFPMIKDSSFFNGSMAPLPDTDHSQKELLPGDIALITVSLVVLLFLIVPLILRSSVAPICRDSCRNESSPSMEYPITTTLAVDLPHHPNGQEILSDVGLVEAFVSPNEVSNIIATSPSILTLTNYDTSKMLTEDFPEHSRQFPEYCPNDIMESLDAATSLRFTTPPSSSSDEEAAHSSSSSEEEMILALLSTASKTSPSSSIASERSFHHFNEDFAISPSHFTGRKPSDMHEDDVHEEMKAALYASSLASTDKI